MTANVLKGQNCDVHVWSPLHEVESQALTQLRRVTTLPWVYHHVAAMADLHVGRGCTVGSVIAMRDAVSPAAVGVDIGCGMAAIKTSLVASNLPDDLTSIRHQIERDIPVGFNSHDRSVWDKQRLQPFDTWLSRDGRALFAEFDTLVPVVQGLAAKAEKQCGTLGGGNHFIELCLDEAQGVWMMLHSGSRNIGKELAEIHIERAQALAHNQALEDPDLAVFLAGTQGMKSYRNDLYWAQRYAFLNRRTMLALYKDALTRFFPNVVFDEPILCHHNYVAEETHFGEQVFVTRKGAINAEKGRLGIIPGSMGTRSYIVRGLGNPDSFNSASHGAGRRLSRGAAKRTFTLEDLKTQTAGVCCRTDAGVLDEIPGAYKDIETVMENQKDLVEVIATLKQVLCVKG